MAQEVSIWVDADACPRVIRDILCRAATRRQVAMIFVANHHVPVPPSPYVRSVQVQQGFDVADNHIAQQVRANDLVITSDIPLAAEVIEQGAEAVSPRGERFTRENIRPRLNMRDFMDTMRSSGEVGGGPPALGAREKQAFANALDRYLARNV
ncbi:MAG: YaiI/YqxD family protein [Halioglobus sp.]|nr:YaiI/YqxD family protein [Halioglobus sp.]